MIQVDEYSSMVRYIQAVAKAMYYESNGDYITGKLFRIDAEMAWNLMTERDKNVVEIWHKTF